MRRLTDRDGAASGLAWSPDGRRLAIFGAREGRADIDVFIAIRGGELAVTVMRPDGSGERRLLSAAGDLTGLPLFAWQPR